MHTPPKTPKSANWTCKGNMHRKVTVHAKTFLKETSFVLVNWPKIYIFFARILSHSGGVNLFESMERLGFVFLITPQSISFFFPHILFIPLGQKGDSWVPENIILGNGTSSISLVFLAKMTLLNSICLKTTGRPPWRSGSPSNQNIYRSWPSVKPRVSFKKAPPPTSFLHDCMLLWWQK